MHVYDTVDWLPGFLLQVSVYSLLMQQGWLVSQKISTIMKNFCEPKLEITILLPWLKTIFYKITYFTGFGCKAGRKLFVMGGNVSAHYGISSLHVT